MTQSNADNSGDSGEDDAPTTGRPDAGVELDDIFATLNALTGRHRPTLLIVWGVVAAVFAVGGLFDGLVSMYMTQALDIQQAALNPGKADLVELTQQMESAVGPVLFVGVGGLVMRLVEATTLAASIGPVRTAWVDRPRLGASQVVASLGSKLPYSALVVTFVAFGLVCSACLFVLPVFVALYFAAPFVYLSETDSDRGLQANLWRAVSWGKRHVSVILVFYVFGLGLAVCGACLGGIGANGAIEVVGPAGHLVGEMINVAFKVAMGFAIWLLFLSVFLTVDDVESEERSENIKRS